MAISSKKITFILFFLFAHTAFAAVYLNEIQIAPTNERFIELYNSDNATVDLTGWYIQRKTATGNSFSSLVTSTELAGKIIRPNDYFLISRSQMSNSDVVVGDLTLTESNTVRMRDSKGKDIDQVAWGSIDAVKSYQRTSSDGWFMGAPTPGAVNAGTANVSAQNSNVSVSQSVNTASSPATPQITAQAGPQTRVVLAGAPIIFEGKVAGLENNSGVATHTIWSFGDGASAEGNSVSHTYYYPGEYTAILDAVSGGVTATDRMLVRVVLPNLSLSAGGDATRSFFTIENHGSDELDISGWQVASDNKTFTFPKNSILGARKSVTFAGEVTGLATPVGSVPELRFQNGSRVDVKTEPKSAPVVSQALAQKVTEKPLVKSVTQTRTVAIAPQHQQASILSALSDAQTPIPAQKEGNLWPWYIGSAFLGALALLGIRLTQSAGQKTTFTANDFEIVEETDDNKPY